MQRLIRADRKFDKISDSIIEKQALQSGGDILQTTKMMGQLGDKLEGGLKYMWASQAVKQNLTDTLYKMANSLRKNEKTYTKNSNCIDLVDDILSKRKYISIMKKICYAGVKISPSYFFVFKKIYKIVFIKI